MWLSITDTINVLSGRITVPAPVQAAVSSVYHCFIAPAQAQTNKDVYPEPLLLVLLGTLWSATEEGETDGRRWSPCSTL